jgi:hypothetical protein
MMDRNLLGRVGPRVLFATLAFALLVASDAQAGRKKSRGCGSSCGSTAAPVVTTGCGGCGATAAAPVMTGCGGCAATTACGGCSTDTCATTECCSKEKGCGKAKKSKGDCVTGTCSTGTVATSVAATCPSDCGQAVEVAGVQVGNGRVVETQAAPVVVTPVAHAAPVMTAGTCRNCRR